LKICVIGDSGVGKTSLIQKYTNQHTILKKTTLAAEFSCKDISLLSQPTRLHIWETSGDKTFQALTPAFFNGADACVIVYQANSRKSVESVLHWKAFFEETVSTVNMPVAVVANKTDLGCQYGALEAQKYLHKHCKRSNMKYFETNSEDLDEISHIFQEVAEEAFKLSRLYQMSPEYETRSETDTSLPSPIFKAN